MSKRDRCALETPQRVELGGFWVHIAPIMALAFRKMHGAGNDFVIFDGRSGDFSLSPDQIRRVSARGHGLGCDQLIVMEPAQSDAADLFMRIYNADGSEAGACGNATRCVAQLGLEDLDGDQITIETIAGLLPCTQDNEGIITANMGPARLGWDDVPMAVEGPTDKVDLTIEAEGGALSAPGALSMGNPHVVFFVEDVANFPVSTIGPRIETDELFPERVNVGFAEVTANNSMTLRVWERGVGETLACGSGACAALVAANRQGLTGREADVHLPGGTLHIIWAEDGDVLMAGPTALVATGELSDEFLASD